MRYFIYEVLDFAIRQLTKVRNRFATPVPEARMLRAMFSPPIHQKMQTAWTVEEILAREG